MPDEDVIESAPRPKSSWRRTAGQALLHPAGSVALVILGFLAGSVGGFVVGHNNPRTLSGLGYLSFSPDAGGREALGLEPFDPNYGRTPLPLLTREDLSAIGETVTNEVGVVSAQSSILVLCGTGIAQPGTDYPSRSPAVVYGVAGGDITELIWPQANDAAASVTLHTLVFQAQLCPEIPDFQARVRTSGVITGIGEEYVIVTREPMMPDAQGAFYATTVLVRVGADLIEIAVTSEDQAVPDAEARGIRAAVAAVTKAAGG